MKRIEFSKYDAAGNTFLVVELASSKVDRRFLGRISQQLCDAKSGVGADGLLTIRPSNRADFALDIFNADGSWAERSGNGLRAAVAHVSLRRARKTGWTIACQRECVAARIISRSVKRIVISSQVGVPRFSKPSYDGGCLKLSQLPELKVAGKTYRYMCLSIGNPHLTVIVRSIPQDWVDIGEAISSLARFRRGVNIEFVRSHSPTRIEIRSYERGVGPTASSGTGAAAALAALRSLGKANMRAAVDFGSEELSAAWSVPGERVTVTGPVKLRFSGEVAL